MRQPLDPEQMAMREDGAGRCGHVKSPPIGGNDRVGKREAPSRAPRDLPVLEPDLREVEDGATPPTAHEKA
jgi:hypothetical protein